MRAQKHSSSLVGCGDATKAEDHPDVREKVKNKVGRLGGGSCAGVFKVKQKTVVS